MAKRVNFKYDAFSNKISVTLRLAVAVVTPWLAEMMGFEDIMLNPLKADALENCEVEHNVQDLSASRSVDIKRGMNSLYVYTDIIQDQIVGHTMVPLLRSVPADGVRGSISYKEMLRVHYLPVQKKSFHTIHLYITNDVGELVPFHSGRSVVTLHFRRSGITSRWGLSLTTDLHVIIMIITCNRQEMVVYQYTPDIAYNAGLVWQIYSLDCGVLLYRYLKTQLKELPKGAWKQGYVWLGMYCVDANWKIHWNIGGLRY